MNSGEKQHHARVQMELEYDVSSDGDLFLKEGSTQKARVVIYLVDDVLVHYFRHDVPGSTRHKIKALRAHESVLEHFAVNRILQREPGDSGLYYGKSYVLVKRFGREHFPLVVQQEGGFCILLNGEVASRAYSYREDDFAGELRVDTAPQYLRRGYATQVVLAWAAALQAAGKVPFYSHFAENAASEALVRRLEGVRFCTVAAYD